ncbi:MAG: helix-turn-helix domain-containing protein [Candidatus Aenigmatarchaeota archaeon]
MGKHGKAEDRVYQFVCKNPGMNTYKISKELKMSGGNVRNALHNLHKKGLIFFKFEKKSNKIEKKCFAVKLMNLLPKTLKRQLKNIVRV